VTPDDPTLRSWKSGPGSPTSGDDNSRRSRRPCAERSSAGLIAAAFMAVLVLVNTGRNDKTTQPGAPAGGDAV
jgi:hypothetical protein